MRNGEIWGGKKKCLGMGAECPASSYWGSVTDNEAIEQ